jgi:hypothetical protein
MDAAPGMATMKIFKIVFECLISTLMFTLFLCAQDKGTQWEISRRIDSITAMLKSTNEPTTVLTLVSYTLRAPRSSPPISHVTYPKSDIQMLVVYFDDEREGDELYVEPGFTEDPTHAKGKPVNYYESGLQFEFDDGGKPMLAVCPICCVIGQRIVGDVDGRVVVEPVLDSRSNRHAPYAIRWKEWPTLTAHNHKKDNFYRRTFLDRLASSKQMTISYKLESGASKHAKFDLNGTKDIIHQLAAGKEVVYLDAGRRDAYSIH